MVHCAPGSIPSYNSQVPRYFRIAAIWLCSTAVAAHAEPTAQALLERYQCSRCHDGTGQAPAPEAKHCVHCHQSILSGTFSAPPVELARWQKNLVSLRAVPSLTAIGKRLQRKWVASFLLKPVDLRPALPATMPRLNITPREAELLSRYLVPVEAPLPPPSKEGMAAGRVLLDTLGCGTCHQFTGVAPAKPAPAAIPSKDFATALLLAPDLRYTRERFQAGALAAWLRAPTEQKPDTLMPTIAMTASQAEQLAAYLLYAPLASPTTTPVPQRLPILSRRVGFEEVNAAVFRRTCWHCHSSADYALGDGGPGNTGGFGFPPRGLNLASYPDVAAGSLDDHGERRSIFLPLSDGTPRLLAHLLARQQEEVGRTISGIRGMPLGLPALSPQQLQLVESWIAQGRPR